MASTKQLYKVRIIQTYSQYNSQIPARTYQPKSLDSRREGYVMTQKEMVLHYMQTHESITQMDAIRELGCTRLGARIWDLVHLDGISIGREMVTRVNRFGKPTTFARYWLER